ncbi:uncharacterized protein A1O9_06863 [Exophiala aquamarina CBS 119918]|uniref:Fungal N-terminal domain-containing protein n=1 Tax=Exophiala aquamarina CBS 119918 TaxID=1182545 RepID=A0A072P971_9EURO|nr:uncharacterized protein A1O9_06863 [Exophiala aquamarina CBS 119918]KEF56674.1 hypothetical protein A1O9_06863 [Exophiala aquamarina CBS 119918]
MADIDIVASIIGVAAAGFRLSLILNAVSCEVASDGLEIHSISKSVTLFATMLKQAGNVLQSPNSVHSHDALTTAKSIADESTRVFDEINDMLDRVRTKPTNGAFSPSIEQRFKWCFKRHRVTYLLNQLESLKLSLSLLLQILQLGKLMASTSRNDPPDEVAVKTEAIRQERAEAQNGVIVRYWQMSQMDRLYEASSQEEEEDKQAQATISNFAQEDNMSLVTTSSSQLTIEGPPPEYTPSTALVQLPVYSLGELDQTLHQIKQSPRDMIQVSDRAIDPLLERWTNWREVRERRHTRDPSSRYIPSVQNLTEEDEDRPFHEKYQEREESPRGYYIEGTTMDWRKPNSASARHEAIRRRKQYSNYQPSVSAASSDLEDSPGSTGSKKRASKRHVINSGSDTDSSDSEREIVQPKPRRRSSGGPTTERKILSPDGAPLAHTYTAPTQAPPWITNNSTSNTVRAPSVISSSQSTASRLSSPAYLPPGHRPWATPDQNLMHHSISSPLPPVHTANAPNPYAHVQQQANTLVYPRHYSSQLQVQPQTQGPMTPHNPPPAGSPQARYAPLAPPARMGMPPRPVSQDGKPRSPSRLSQQYNSNSLGGREHTRGSGSGSGGGDEHHGHSRHHPKEKSAKHNLREGATKGLLGAGAIAGFLEALEGLNI